MGERKPDDKQLVLREFFPYRLAVFSNDVSRAVAQLYGGRFQLSRSEWRVLAALGDSSGLSAKEIADYSTLEKMQVSRATSALLKAGLIEREEDERDRRHLRHRLSKKGRSLYQELIPLVRARQDYMLSALSDEERTQLDELIERIHAKALELQQWG